MGVTTRESQVESGRYVWERNQLLYLTNYENRPLLYINNWNRNRNQIRVDGIVAIGNASPIRMAM